MSLLETVLWWVTPSRVAPSKEDLLLVVALWIAFNYYRRVHL